MNRARKIVLWLLTWATIFLSGIAFAMNELAGVVTILAATMMAAYLFLDMLAPKEDVKPA